MHHHRDQRADERSHHRGGGDLVELVREGFVQPSGQLGLSAEQQPERVALQRRAGQDHPDPDRYQPGEQLVGKGAGGEDPLGGTQQHVGRVFAGVPKPDLGLGQAQPLGVVREEDLLLGAGIDILAGLLLVAMFRAPLIAVKAAVLALLSIGTAYGVLVVVFQRRWGLWLIVSTARYRSCPWCRCCSSPCCSACRWTTLLSLLSHRAWWPVRRAG
ncbi:hypothetical protein O7621_04825 [Solwaraspora sp. WMMD937]|uniref:hypothetical protein n=1 Tax=Solwaraspora sp. WMMD937 TaxID=3016090 RepID=UPI00249C93AB|nr:hypothetical protein [Solwaraspora sp. WMMD937]WFE22673.1 hypothetical protein O7621_04825 [Solwaraspora sp. WMMD937]